MSQKRRRLDPTREGVLRSGFHPNEIIKKYLCCVLARDKSVPLDGEFIDNMFLNLEWLGTPAFRLTHFFLHLCKERGLYDTKECFSNFSCCQLLCALVWHIFLIEKINSFIIQQRRFSYRKRRNVRFFSSMKIRVCGAKNPLISHE